MFKRSYFVVSKYKVSIVQLKNLKFCAQIKCTVEQFMYF
jgi:hypothetical protein